MEELHEYLTSLNPNIRYCDGYDGAILGTAERINLGPVVVYDIEKIIEISINEHGMNEEQARENFDFNIIESYIDENMPIFFTKIECYYEFFKK
jgi:hypothetical protein